MLNTATKLAAYKLPQISGPFLKDVRCRQLTPSYRLLGRRDESDHARILQEKRGTVIYFHSTLDGGVMVGVRTKTGLKIPVVGDCAMGFSGGGIFLENELLGFPCLVTGGLTYAKHILSLKGFIAEAIHDKVIKSADAEGMRRIVEI